MPLRFLSPLLIALAAMLWGSDVLLRSQALSAGWSPARLVLGEHLILCVLFLPALWAGRSEFKRLTRAQWAALLFVGWGGSALATWLYTTAFALDSSRALTVVLLQKTQPVVAILLAGWVLRERRGALFWLWAVGAMAGAYFLIGFQKPPNLRDVQAEQALLALGASALWGVATVAGRLLTPTLTPPRLAGARFAVAVPALALLTLVPTTSYPAPLLLPSLHASLGPLGYALLFLGLIALLPDLAGMTLYYRGLKGTPASAATLAELCYPLTSLLLGVAVLHAPVTGGQWLGLAVLVVSVLGLTYRPGVSAAKEKSNVPLPVS